MPWNRRGGPGPVVPAVQRGYMRSENLSELLRKLKIACVSHGFRSSFGNRAGASREFQSRFPKWFWLTCRRHRL